MTPKENRAQVELTPETRRALRVWKAGHDLTYDEAVSTLLAVADTADEDAVQAALAARKRGGA